MNNKSTFAQLFYQQFKHFSDEFQLPTQYLNWMFRISTTATTHT